MSMACLSEWTQAQEPESINAADEQLRERRKHVPPVPRAAALSTLTFLMQRAKERTLKRAEAGSTKRKAVAALLASPSAKKKRTAENSVSFESPRSRLLQRLAQDLESPKYQVYFHAIASCVEKGHSGRSQRELCGHETTAVSSSGQLSACQNRSHKSLQVLGRFSVCFFLLFLVLFLETGSFMCVHCCFLINLPVWSSTSTRRSCTGNQHCLWQQPLDE